MSAEQTYIAFLRAVNVGGRKVEMARLREVMTGLGLDSVRTYIASGNVFFTAPETGAADDRAALADRIETRLADEFGFQVPTILRTAPELAAELAASPFVGRSPAGDERFSVVFTSGSLPGNDFPLCSPKGDWEILGATGGTAFALWRLLGGRLGGNPIPLLERTYGVRATGRFFHTTEKILAAARKG
jgi:hypothetical protein